MKAIKYLVRIFWIASIAAVLVTEARAGVPDPIAGPDLVVADFDGDQEVTIMLNGSASSSPDGAIVSYVWTWPDGTATGATPEVVFPVSNGAITVSLTVTDVLNQSATDTLEVSVYDKETALFTDFPSLSFNNATVAGETMVVSSQVGSTRVYRRNAGNWIETPFSSLSNDDLAIDEDTIFGGTFYDGSSFYVSRYNGSQWVNTPLTLSVPIMPVSGFQLLDYAVDAQTVVVADRYNSLNGSQAGRVFVYDWVGNNLNFSTEIIPPGGFAANDQWGTKVAVEGNLMVIASSNPVGSGNELHIYRKIAGTWSLESAVTADPTSPFFSNSFTAFSISIGNGVILIAANNGSQIMVIEKIGSNWIQTPMASNSFGLTQYFGYKMNNDGLSFVAHDESGRYVLYKKGPEAPTWSGSSVTTRRLLTRDLSPTRDTKVTGFSNGLLAISDSVLQKVRVIDTITSINPINVEPIADAGDDIARTSLDGGPVRVFLDGFASRELNYNSPLTAVWTWAGGSASGLQPFANIPPSVTSIELKVIDIGGVIARDTIQVDIESPPVIDAGPDVTVVDTDGDGSIQLEVNGSVISPDNPILSWTWSWPSGSLNGQSGTITLDEATNGRTVTLSVLDSNRLVSRDEFTVRILNKTPTPNIIQPVVGAPQDLFGNHVSIENDTALISAPGFKIDGEPVGATFLSENINNRWQQLSLSPGAQQGSCVLIDGDTAFVGASNLSREQSGQIYYNAGGVYIYKRQSGSWNQTGLLRSPDPVSYENSEYTTFGASMAKSGNWLAIGSPGANNPGAGRSGAVFLFEQVGGNWTFRQKIISPDAENFSAFGFAVAISGTSLVVTSDYYQGRYDTGVAHVFAKGPSQWDFVQKLESDDTSTSANDGFGRSVAMSDTEIFIGADQELNGAISSIYSRGVIYRFSKSGSNWSRTAKLAPAVAPPSDASSFFGTSLFLRNGTLLASSPWDSGLSTATNTTIYGRVHIYRLSGSNLAFVDHIDLNNSFEPLPGFGLFGFSIAHDTRDLIVGAPNARNSSGQTTGKVYIFQDYAALNPDANYEPLANAGADLSVNDTLVRGPAPSYLITEPLGSELVTLNASASTDQENAIATYAWTWPGGSATGVSPSARFPVGKTTVTLTVSDNKGIVNSDTVEVTVTLAQTAPAALPVVSGNTLTVGLPSPLAKWRLSSEFLWHGDNESTNGVVLGATYQVEIIPYPGSTEVISTFITIDSPAMTVDLELQLPTQPTTTGSISFPETSQGFSWRLIGESSWRDVTDDNDGLIESIEFLVPAGAQRLEFKPVAGFTTPQNRLVIVGGNTLTSLDWADYLRINSFNPAKTFELASAPDLSASPYQYVGMIRSALGRGTGTVVAERTVLTAAHLFFDSNGLQWADTQWHSRQQQGTRQAPPIAPRGVLYQTSYAKLIAPDSVEGTVADLPEDPQEVDFAVLFFADQATWDQGSANFLQSTPAKNWLTGGESKHAVAYPQRSQTYENRGKIFQKQFTTPLESLGTGLYETTEVFGDGGASGSALFVQPGGSGSFYPAAILLAGQGRAVYRVIDEDITRMIRDGADAATGNDDVLNNDSSLVVFNGLGSLTTIGVQVAPEWLAAHVRWSIYPANAAAVTNMPVSQRVAFNTKWTGYTIVFSAVSGYYTPANFYQANASVTRGAANIRSVTYNLIPPPLPPPPPPTPLQTWLAARGITDLGSDDDKDGMSALLEYALDRNTGAPDYLPAILMSGNPSQGLYAEYDVFVSSTAAGISYHVKASNSPDRSNAVTLATFTNADGSSAYRRVTDTQLRSASPTRFAWVEVVAP